MLFVPKFVQEIKQKRCLKYEIRMIKRTIRMLALIINFNHTVSYKDKKLKQKQMKTKNTAEFSLIRSRVLDFAIALVISALIMLPFVTMAKGKDKSTTTGKVYMHPLQKQAHATITLAEFEEGYSTISIEGGSNNDVYYSEILNTPQNFSKVFDLSTLDDGDYSLKVKVKNDIKERHFSIEDGKISVMYENLAEPKFNAVGQKAFFELPNTGQTAYSISVISPKGEELYSSNSNDEIIKKQFDFSSSEFGAYQVNVSSNVDAYSFSFNNEER